MEYWEKYLDDYKKDRKDKRKRGTPKPSDVLKEIINNYGPVRPVDQYKLRKKIIEDGNI